MNDSQIIKKAICEMQLLVAKNKLTVANQHRNHLSISMMESEVWTLEWILKGLDLPKNKNK